MLEQLVVFLLRTAIVLLGILLFLFPLAASTPVTPIWSMTWTEVFLIYPVNLIGVGAASLVALAMAFRTKEPITSPSFYLALAVGALIQSSVTRKYERVGEVVVFWAMCGAGCLILRATFGWVVAAKRIMFGKNRTERP